MLIHFNDSSRFSPLLSSWFPKVINAYIQDGIAVNAIWPRTAIMTAAMEMLGGGKGIATQCRSAS